MSQGSADKICMVAPPLDPRDYADIVWLKSLKERVQPQNTWKPTREQMKYLAASIEESGGNPVLGSLYEQLKNLYYDTSRKN